MRNGLAGPVLLEACSLFLDDVWANRERVAQGFLACVGGILCFIFPVAGALVAIVGLTSFGLRHRTSGR